MVYNSLFSLLISAFNTTVHPVRIITGRFDVAVLELLLDVHPNLTVFEVRIELNNFHVLLLTWFELV